MRMSQFHAKRNQILTFLNNCKSSAHLHQIQAQIIVQNLQPDTAIAYEFINACHTLGLLNSALQLFTQIFRPHVFICNSLIRAFSQSQIPRVPLSLYSYMHKNAILPNNYTFPFLLNSLSDFHDVKQGQCIHTHVIKLGHLNDIYVQNSLLSVYASSSGHMGLCRQLFDEMPQRDIVSWTVLITGYNRSARYDEALILFELMQYAGVMPNQVTMVNALAACASSGAIDMGVWIHDFIKRSGWELDVILGTALIDMYGKCGRIKEGLRVFESMKHKNNFTWNVLIKGLALAKSGKDAVWWFSRMELERIRVDEVTLVAVLCACSHSGLVAKGREIFCSLIVGKYGFPPGGKHYACMIDLLARAGHLNEALSFLRKMPFQPTKAVWGSILGAARAHKDLELSEFAAWMLVDLEPENGAYYVMLSNMYAEMGRWADVERVRELMKDRGLKKGLGCSSVELEPQEDVYKLMAD